MKEKSNYSKLLKIYKNNGGYITRKNADDANIPSWFLSDFVKKHDLIRIAPGYYADDSYALDEFYVLQRRYPKYIFSGMSALYLNELTDKIPVSREVTAPQGYNPSRHKINDLIIHKVSNEEIYKLGITECKTIYESVVKVYDPERTVCDLIKHRNKYDSETFIKAMYLYAIRYNNQAKLFRYAKILGIEKKVFEVMELVNNEI